MSLVGIPPADIDLIWGWAAATLKPALDYGDGRDTLKSIYADLKRRDKQLWVGVCQDGRPRSACVTLIETFGNRKVATIYMSAGHMDDHIDGVSVIEAWAKERGCDTIEIFGRRGWRRVLPGYKLTYEVLEKKLDGRRQAT